MPLALVVLDGWEPYVAALDAYDGGRTAAALLALMRSGPATGVSIVVTGDRSTLTSAITGCVSARYLLRLADRSDYSLAGVPAACVGLRSAPGRGVRVPDGAAVQIAHAGVDTSRTARLALADDISKRWADGDRRQLHGLAAVVLRPLPQRVRLRDLGRADCSFVLGVGGDAAEPIAIDLVSDTARVLIAGPARSGRTTALRALLHQAGDFGIEVVVAADHRSPLTTVARQRGLRVVEPTDDRPPDCTGPMLLVVDDIERFTDTGAAHWLSATIGSSRKGLAVVGTGNSTDLAVTFRGPAAELRRARCGIVLAPRPADGDLFGVRLPHRIAAIRPGLGVLMPGAAWLPDGAAPESIPIQLALPDDELSPGAGSDGRSAERRSP
jgi:S-DNA-T family DNA segregation ATPase FtsK/SpoIIIE